MSFLPVAYGLSEKGAVPAMTSAVSTFAQAECQRGVIWRMANPLTLLARRRNVGLSAWVTQEGPMPVKGLIHYALEVPNGDVWETFYRDFGLREAEGSAPSRNSVELKT